jgi:hypothetical protein
MDYQTRKDIDDEISRIAALPRGPTYQPRPKPANARLAAIAQKFADRIF